MSDHDRLYFRQLLSGQDFATGDPMARQMVNFVYLIGDRETGEAVVVDPAYAPAELVEIAGADGMTITGALGTHYHADHIGGSIFGHHIAGMEALLEETGVKLHVQADETEWVRKTTGLSASDIVEHAAGDTLTVGEVEITLLHTPGHTPGSQCFLVNGMLVAGDTLFLEGCGRTDLPGSDVTKMYDSLQLLASLPDDTILYPGHRYSVPSSATLGITKEMNFVFKPKTREQWMVMFGQ